MTALRYARTGSPSNKSLPSTRRPKGNFGILFFAAVYSRSIPLEMGGEQLRFASRRLSVWIYQPFKLKSRLAFPSARGG